MGNDQPALRALFACESGLSESEIGLDHAFVLSIWQNIAYRREDGCETH
jgi:hypothetical protein